MDQPDNAALLRELVASQKAFDAGLTKLRRRRQAAVMAALAGGVNKYQIAKAMGVHGPTVDSIIKTAEREKDQKS